MRQINEEISTSTEKQPKRQLSTTKNEKALIIENEDVTVTPPIKKIKKNDINDYSSDDKIALIGNIIE